MTALGLPVLAISAWVVYGAGTTGDLVSTELALRRAGTVEANPLGNTLAKRLLIKGAQTAVLAYGDKHLSKGKRIGLRVGYALWMGFVIQHNLRVGR